LSILAEIPSSPVAFRTDNLFRNFWISEESIVSNLKTDSILGEKILKTRLLKLHASLAPMVEKDLLKQLVIDFLSD